MTTHNTESKSAQVDFAAEGHPGANSFAGHSAALSAHERANIAAGHSAALAPHIHV